ncbi:ribbon-helix-helix domain-containing protein [Streptomyces rimosus]|uniref:ribbon-helix-helix domain-containing protein n=1 Tax=Streptomyces rimosus TaxID=1927 RepID=UPI0004CACF6E|nr:ribbon-helix-helix domain-containing protein [Streptomyces rimosus]
MKISVSLPEEDISFLDAYGKKTDADSRSAVIHAAIELLRASELEADYAQAWQEWDESDDARLWDGVSGDGIGIADAAR